MKVYLIDYTGAGSEKPEPWRYAANIIAYTRSTRLQMSPGLLMEIQEKSDDEVLNELKLAAGTLPSSWEFIQFTFLIEGVTRAFTHQLVRTRTASYAQQAMRIVDMSEGPGWTYGEGNTIANDSHRKAVYKNAMADVARAYQDLLKLGATNEDARGVLPTNIHTNINMSINMRNFINLVRKRSSARVQDEYRNVMDLMTIEVEKVYPWFYMFYKNDQFKARKDLQEMIFDNKTLTFEEKTNMVKKLDIMMPDL